MNTGPDDAGVAGSTALDTLIKEWHDDIADECARIGHLDRPARWIRVALLLASGDTEAATLAEAAATALDDAERGRGEG